jgi:hypothetical protein
MRMEPPISVPRPSDATTLQLKIKFSHNTVLTSPDANERTLTTRTSASSQFPVFGVQGISDDIVDRLARHQCMRYTRFAVQHCTSIPQHRDHLALVHLLFSSSLLALESADPANISHARLDALYVKLILQ